MQSAEELQKAFETARKSKKSISRVLDPTLDFEICDCKLCFGSGIEYHYSTVNKHRRINGQHPDARPQPAPIPGPSRVRSPTPAPINENHDEELIQFDPLFESTPPRARGRSRSRSLSGSGSLSGSAARTQSESGNGFASGSCAGSTGSWSPFPSSQNSPIPPPAPVLRRRRSPSTSPSRSTTPSGSDNEGDPSLLPGDPEADALLFGERLRLDRQVAQPPPLRLRGGADIDAGDGGDGGDGGNEDGEGGERDEDDGDGGDGGGGNEDEEGGVAEPQIRVPPDDEGGPAGWDGPAVAGDEHPTLRNVYLRTWALYAFGQATHDTIQATLKSQQLTLRAAAQFGGFPPEFIAQIDNMPLTLRSLERRIGMDFSESITVYATCPIETCGKRYTLEQIRTLPHPRCIRHIAEPRCSGVLYTETTLADGTQKRTPTKTYPYNSLPDALGRLLSRKGVPDSMQLWRGPDDAPADGDGLANADELANANIPPPQGAQQWFDTTGDNQPFGAISEGWKWRTEATGLRRRIDEEGIVDEAIGDQALALSQLRLGLSLSLNLDGFRAFRNKFSKGGSYSVNGVYLVVNNFPPHLRTLIENTILAIMIPGPKEPKGYALDQMLEPLVDDLIKLAEGMLLPVYNRQTRRVELYFVHAKLSAVIVDWIARIKCAGQVGVTSEHNHCLFCKMRTCYLCRERGYLSAGYEYRNHEEHLQHKFEWFRAPEHEREAIRQRTGTTFVEFDRLPAFYATLDCSLDTMHLFDHGTTPALIRDIIYKPGMLRKRYFRQPEPETPEGRFDAMLARTYFPSECSRLPTKISKMKSNMTAEGWRNMLQILPIALFEAWRIGDAIPDGDIPRGGRTTKHRKAQDANARLLLQRRRNAHDADGGDLDDFPDIEDCASSRNPRDYLHNVMRYCVAYNQISRYQITRQGISDATALLELVGVSFTRMNIHLVPSFHNTTHIGDTLTAYGNAANTSTNDFERMNRVAMKVNTNGHGQGVLETTMMKGFLRRANIYCYDIQNPTFDDIATTGVLLDMTRNAPEHEAERGVLDAVLAGQAPFHGQEHIKMATTCARVDFYTPVHRPYYELFIRFLNDHNPYLRHQFYGPGIRPEGGIYIPHVGETFAYPYFCRYGIRYGSAMHSCGRNARYGYINGRTPVLIKGIYEITVETEGRQHTFAAAMVQRFVVPARDPVFLWAYWADMMRIDHWEYNALHPVEAVPLDVFTGNFILTDIEMPYGHYWLTIGRPRTEPPDVDVDVDVDD
ncbi:hypothetical protein FRC09_015154 [Ceratobasidium sp. 395]|nr:hypothetical protein FRC09_015154 [Ceratobasidium sp. 395]